MQNITGKIAFGGIAIGKIKEISKENNVVRRVKIEDAKAEIARFEAARDQAAEELKGLYDKAVKEVGEANAAIFEVHQMMLEDEDYLDSVRNIIEAQSVNAEFAVATTGDNFARMFADMDDDYMKERAADVKDISERVIRVLSQKEEKVNTSGAEKEKYIIAADDLAPEYKDSDNYWFSKGVTVVGFIVNNDILKEKGLEAPKTWDDLRLWYPQQFRKK